ncbi:NADPH oxidase [Cladophialophora psammophila CBS 110553]|uniref:NADPH oxidase n=1 Tax=Cladophialophora psammophila CBS 110553 TaxID=1182543 RepID=W9X669_9EURO|nr:NADPH oxidase [Cladophialophora psammophila CBS 110553]EXJ75733.1 NADPH oxidase [Cladophialophora psammophila CBS 110553]
MSERTRSTPLMRMLLSGEVSGEEPRDLSPKERFNRWMVNEGSRRLFVGVFILVHCMLYGFGFMNYTLKDNLTKARATYGYGYPIARSAALVLHFDVACILLPVCRTLISLVRQTPLNGIIPFDKNITFHKLVGYSIVFFTWVHTIAHLHNVAQLSAKGHGGFIGFVKLNFLTGPGWTGYVLTISVMAMFFTALEKPRRANYERFWNTHHLFVIFFIMWSIHGAFCMIPADNKPFCFGNGSFYLYWMIGGFTYLVERILREIRGYQKTYITKVIEHPSNVVEIRIKKEHTKTRAGQYIFLCCPEISLWQYHPFTLTSAPEEDYLSVHIRMVGDFTKTLGKVLGCQGLKSIDDKKANRSEVMSTIYESDTKLTKILPRLYIDGPFGSASEDVFKFETVLLIGAGIGVTPFASILKSIWYRMRDMRSDAPKTRLRKVYFFWVCRDFGSLEWFKSLLTAIESEDKSHAIEIHAYLTAKITAAQASNIVLNSGDTDAITGLRTPTNYGRPNWDMVFRAIRKIHWPGECGVFFCGPKGLGAELHIKCNMYTDPGDKGYSFVWGKENF